MPNNDLNRVEHLKNRLYSRSRPYELKDNRSEIKLPDHELEGEWKKDAHVPLTPQQEERKKGSFLTKLFIISVIFFLVSVTVAGALYYFGANQISPKNVDISIAGPVSVAAGESASFELIIENRNSADIANLMATVLFPEGSRSPDDLQTELQAEKISIGAVPAGESVRRTVKAVLFGEKDTVQDIKVSIDYNISGTNASYQQEKTYQVGIKSSPIILTVNYPKEVNAAQEMEIVLEATSNTNATLENIAVQAEYPFGFVYSGSDPAPFYENNVWHLGDFKPLEKKTITIKGEIHAQHEEERTFRFFTGNVSTEDDRKIGVNLTSSLASIVIKRPYLALDLLFRRGDGEQVIQAGGRSDIEVHWKNNLPSTVSNGTVEVKISGAIFDEEKVNANSNGYYRSLDNTVLWDRTMVKELAEIRPGNEKTVGFSVTTKEVTKELISQIQNPEVVVTATMNGSRIMEDGVPEKLTSTATKRIKVASELGLTSRLVHSIGPFDNTGPVPPKVDMETTYTVIWSVTNSFNNVSGARASAMLPTYVKWLGAVSPSGEKVGYNPVTQEVVWEIGEVKRGTGYLTSPREVAFQVSVTPSITDVGHTPAVIGETTITGRDNFTTTTLRNVIRGLTTLLSTDPSFKLNSGTVVK